MIFDLYEPFYSPRQDKWCPGVKARHLSLETFVEQVSNEGNKMLIESVRAGNKADKLKLPAACWVGQSKTGLRKAEDMRPSQFYMIDIDHCAAPREAFDEITKGHPDILDECLLAHVTPSGKGLRLVLRAQRPLPTLIEHMEWARETYGLDKYGDFDTAVKDLSRLSFLPYKDDILWINRQMFDAPPSHYEPIKSAVADTAAQPYKNVVADALAEVIESAVVNTTTQPKAKEAARQEDFSEYTYRGHKVSDIIEKYVEVYGTPDSGERHNFYNQMVKYFRCIVDNNPLALNALLPKFGHTEEETLSQCQSICRTNTVSRLPREFFLFLLHNGFYNKSNAAAVDDDAEVAEPNTEFVDKMPTLPPVFREYVNSAPRDFKIPCINALMPIMGTLTSYLRSYYPIDGEEHGTNFFSIIYAPSGAGKSFVKRIVKTLLSDLAVRDQLCDARDRLYNSVRETKGSNDKGPKNPHVQLRLAEAKISETELLEKQANNKGHHMFTFAAEIDQWAKGARAAGGNKDDMLRIAWDGGEYGQHYKSANSFKGKVNLYWNILMTGTEDQMMKYFQRNTTNGLVQRCCFTEIENQRFSGINKWRELSQKDMTVIDKFKKRCDERCYSKPLDFDMETLETVSDEDFDEEVPWNYEFRPFVYVELDWLWPVIKQFLETELNKAREEQNDARDSWRKRSAVRGYRLAMICTQCWDKIGKREKKIISDFVAWWMQVDLEASLLPFEKSYNEVNGDTQKATKKMSLYDALNDEFTRSELALMCRQMNVRSRVRNVICDWRKIGIIEEVAERKDDFGKVIYKKIKK